MMRLMTAAVVAAMLAGCASNFTERLPGETEAEWQAREMQTRMAISGNLSNQGQYWQSRAQPQPVAPNPVVNCTQRAIGQTVQTTCY
jgi:Spy/CpxP family protein refolding chaperone